MVQVKREDLLPARITGLWFTYMSIFLFALMPNFEVYLNLWEILGISAVLTALINLWNLYKEEPIMDERKVRVATDGMAWAFVAVSLLLLPMGTTGVDITPELVRDTAAMGLWTWLIYFSVRNLYHKYGGGRGD